MKLYILLLILIFSIDKFKSQIFNFDTLIGIELRGYDVYFIGEQHYISTTDDIETKLVSMLKTTKTDLLLEIGYNRNHIFEDFFIKNDSVNYPFYNSENNKWHSKLYRLLHNNNIVPKAIDVIQKHYFEKEYILEKYNNKTITSSEVENDIKVFSER